MTASNDYSLASDDQINPFDDTPQTTALDISPINNEALNHIKPSPTSSSSSTAPVSTLHEESDENPFESASTLPHALHVDITTIATTEVTTPSTKLEPEILPVSWKRETRTLLKLALPAVFVNLLFVSMGTGSQMLVGHIDSEALAAAVCANMIFNIVWFFSFGFAGALDTLAAQSFGAGSMQGVNLWTKRALLLVSLLTIPTSIPIFFSYDIMHSILGQTPAVAMAAQTYCRWLVFGVWPFNMTIVLQKYLQAQGIMAPTIWIAAVANVINILIELLLIWPCGMGLQGGALGMSLTRWFQFVVTVWYVVARVKRLEREELDQVADSIRSSPISSPSQAEMMELTNEQHTAIEMDDSSNEPAASPSNANGTITPSRFALLRQSSSAMLANSARSLKQGARSSMRSLASGAKAAASYAKDPKSLVRDMNTLQKASMEGVMNKAAIKLFCTIGLSSGLMSCLEAWCFEFTGIMATSLPLIELDAHYVLLNTTLITYFTFPFGVSIAASIRIGNLIGAGHVETAKLCSKIVGLIGAGFMALSGIMLASTAPVIGWIFSNDATVVAQVARIAPIGGIFQLFDGLQGSTAGVLRGLGLQKIAAVTNFCGLWFCGVLSAYLITFPGHVGLPGLWWGLAIGLFVTAGLNCLTLYRTDWHKQVALAQERIRLDEEEYAKRRAEIMEEALKAEQEAEAAASSASYQPAVTHHHGPPVTDL